MPAPRTDQPAGLGFGTAPVFLASISTILGAVMFLRFGYAVGHTGLGGTLLIILLGHLVTVPTALAIAEIATNRRVEGGGEYYIISRSFGSTIGGTLGLALYFSQAVSVAFYMIAFAEAFRPLAGWFEQILGQPFDPRLISVPGTLLLLGLLLTRGARIGVAVLWCVVVVLGVSLLLFFLGGGLESETSEGFSFLARTENPHAFMLVFAICFPAFTGMTAGVGLSGDLANPRKSIPWGILSATGAGLLVYVAVVVKLAVSASPEQLAEDQLIMSRIALWGPVIPIGLACATISSAIGSFLVAPRTLQALAKDGFPQIKAASRFLAAGAGEGGEPLRATMVTGLLALGVTFLGDVDIVARIISMFFMVTYGSLCAISALEYFAARPGYRPAFRSKWYLSLVGAVASFLLMFQMDPLFALLSIVLMVVVYRLVKRGVTDDGNDLAAIFQGVMTQATRSFHIQLQNKVRYGLIDWRPSIITVNGRTFERRSHLLLMSWLCHRYAFGTYLHFIKGRLEATSYERNREVQTQLIRFCREQFPGVFADTIVSPSMRSALAQSLQVPGISGLENNTVLFEFLERDSGEELQEVLDGCELSLGARLNTLVLRHGENFFGNRGELHVWLTWHDLDNVGLMVLLSYILMGHPDWRRTEVRVFAAYPSEQVSEQRDRLDQMIFGGRIPISPHNLTILGTQSKGDFAGLVEEKSRGAGLVILGFTPTRFEAKGGDLFRKYPGLHDVLFVCAREAVEIQ